MFVAVLFAILTATVAANSQCPDAKPVKKFNMTAYSGVWYQAARYDNGLRTKESCYHVECTAEDFMAILKATIVHSNLYPESFDIIVTYADDTLSGNTTTNVKRRANGKIINSEYNYLVLSVDYNEYAIIFYCYFDKKTESNKQLLWIFSRNRKLEGKAKTEVENYMKSTKFLDWDKLVWIDNSEDACLAYH